MKILDLWSYTCFSSSERRALDPNGWDPRYNTHCGNILLLDFLFSCIKAFDAIIVIIAIFGYIAKTSIGDFLICNVILYLCWILLRLSQRIYITCHLIHVVLLLNEYTLSCLNKNIEKVLDILTNIGLGDNSDIIALTYARDSKFSFD